MRVPASCPLRAEARWGVLDTLCHPEVAAHLPVTVGCVMSTWL